MYKGLFKFEGRKPSKPYSWVGVELQFYVENFEEEETKEVVTEEGTEVVVVEYAYDLYTLSWREEFSQQAEYDEEGNLVKDDYVSANYDSLLAEAMQDKI